MRLHKNFWYLMSVLLAGVSPLALAHEGHDHQHWSSIIIHGFTIFSIAIAGFACAIALFKLVNRKSSVGEQ